MATTLTGIVRDSSRGMKVINGLINSVTASVTASTVTGKNSSSVIGNARVWLAPEAPVVDNNDQALAYSVKKGDYVIDYTNQTAYLCTVGVVTGVTSATFIQIGG